MISPICIRMLLISGLWIENQLIKEMRQRKV